jgi:hypothetical protein
MPFTGPAPVLLQCTEDARQREQGGFLVIYPKSLNIFCLFWALSNVGDLNREMRQHENGYNWRENSGGNNR